MSYPKTPYGQHPVCFRRKNEWVVCQLEFYFEPQFILNEAERSISENMEFLEWYSGTISLI